MGASWPRTKLADCVDLVAGFAFKSDRFSAKPDDVPLVKGENIGQGRIQWEISKRWPAEDWDKLSKFQLRPGDVVVAMDRPWIPAGLKWGFIRENDPRALLVQRVSRLRANNGKLDQGFLRFVVGSPAFENYVRPITTGVNVPHISGRQILDFEFVLPPLPTQKRAAAILSAYDDLIENNQRRIRILEEMARALYREWFIDFHFPGRETVSFGPSALGDAPQGWEVKSFSALASYVNGYAFKPDDWGAEGKPIVKIKELKAGITADTPRNPGDEIPAKYHVQDGDVLFSWSADLNAYLWIGGDALLNQHLFNVFPNDELSRAFCFHALKESMPRFRALSLGATMHHIKRSALDQVLTLVPPVNLRKSFDILVEPMHKQVIALAKQAQNLRQTRDTLLPRLLSGETELEARVEADAAA